MTKIFKHKKAFVLTKRTFMKALKLYNDRPIMPDYGGFMISEKNEEENIKMDGT